ncbi:MAG: cytidylate kinase-like family protein [Desulfobacterales bacterium]|nr:cytidylate kinase-like family protein [Desulfobacterales bacterium]
MLYTNLYVPSTYSSKRPSADVLVSRYIKEWEVQKEKAKQAAKKENIVMPPCICFSRPIGVGALEIADIISEKTKYRVVDRQILEKISTQANISEYTASIFDERFPGQIEQLMGMLFGEKSFAVSDYLKQLTKALLSIAHIETTIFVGRGAYLILPRDRILAVRIIGSKDYRINRVAKIMNISNDVAAKEVACIDKDQNDFFKKLYGKSEVGASEFDLVLCRDHIKNAQDTAEIILFAFKQKFGAELDKC